MVPKRQNRMVFIGCAPPFPSSPVTAHSSEGLPFSKVLALCTCVCLENEKVLRGGPCRPSRLSWPGVDPRPRQQARAITRSWSCQGSTAEREGGTRARLSSGRGWGPPSRGQGGTRGGWGGREGAAPPPHLARRGHGLALAPRPPRRGLPARPLRPAAAAGGESTQALTLSLGNGCRKVPAAAISLSSRGVPGALLRPPTAPGEFWGRRRSAHGSPVPGHLPPPTQRAQPHLRQPVHIARACGKTRSSDAGTELRDRVSQGLPFPFP